MPSSVVDKYVILVPLSLILVACYKFIIHPTFISPLSRVPNAHWSSPLSPIWILWIRYQRRENATLHASHSKYGPILRLGPNEISVNSLDGGIRSVYGGGFEKGQWYSIFDNYGYVNHSQHSNTNFDIQAQCSLHVLGLALTSSFCSKTNDFLRILENSSDFVTGSGISSYHYSLS